MRRRKEGLSEWPLFLYSMHFLYILYSEGSDLYYVGQSGDVSLRLEFHNGLNPNSFTSKHRPWTLKISIEVGSKRLAIKMERYVRRRKSRQYIERLIADEKVVAELIRKCSAG